MQFEYATHGNPSKQNKSKGNNALNKCINCKFIFAEICNQIKYESKTRENLGNGKRAALAAVATHRLIAFFIIRKLNFLALF